MGSRYVEYEEQATCDNCGHRGAFDFMGDYLCQYCCDENKRANKIGYAILRLVFLVILFFWVPIIWIIVELLN